MDKAARKAAARDWRDSARPVGIFAITCTETGETWIGQAKDLDAIWNRQRFSLQAGGHGHRGLQAAWKAHGEAAFLFEELERFDEDLPAVAVPRRLKDRQAALVAERGATAL